MKNKKLLTCLLSVATAAACSLTTFVGCKTHSGCPGSDDGEHKYRWTVETESTCSTHGTRRGVCGLCGDVTTDSLELNPDAHGYGDWQIAPPSEAATGTATKICSYNNSHKVEVTLPVITNSGEGYYAHEYIVAPTTVTEGTLHLELKHEIEDISFNVTIPKRTVTTVEDAVYLGASLGDRIRTSAGRTGVTYYDDLLGAIGMHYSNIECEYGDGYTHITDEGQKEEYWFSLDKEGNAYGVFQRYEAYNANPDPEGPLDIKYKYTDPAVVENVTERNLKGFTYLSGAKDNFAVYGAEDALWGYYSEAKTARENGTAVEYDEHLEKLSDGGFSAWFSFGHYDKPNFGRYKVEFTLDGTGVITYFKLTTDIIRAYMIAETLSGEKLFYENGDVIFAEIYPTDDQNNDLFERDQYGYPICAEGDYKKDVNGTVLKDANGDPIPRPTPIGQTKGYYSYDHQEVSTRVLEYTDRVQKQPDDEIPENPYPADILYIHDFKVKYGGKEINDEAVSVPSNEAFDLAIDSVMPTTATLDYDPLRVYVRTETGDKELTLDVNSNEYLIMGNFNKEAKKVTLRAAKSGEVTIVLKPYGGYVEKVVKLNVRKGPPSSIYAEAYVYNVVNNKVSYRWTEAPMVPDEEDDSTANIKYVTVYAGQSVYVRATCDAFEAPYSDTTFEAEMLFKPSHMTIENHVTLENLQVSRITANQAGEYDIYLGYVKFNDRTQSWEENGNANVGFRLVVLEKPAMSTLFRQTYQTRFDYMQQGNGNAPASAEVTFDYDGNWRAGTVTVRISDSEFTYGYTYDAATNAITINKQSGPDGETYDFSFAINDACDLTVTHSIGVIDGMTETVVLTPKEAE